MSIDIPKDDLSRSVNIDANTAYPKKVQLRLVWDLKGREVLKTIEISSDEFFGMGKYGAPIPAEALIQHIERARREGPPTFVRRRRYFNDKK